MKKVIVSLLAVVTVAFASGCSNISKEEYNSLVEENSYLKSKTDQQEDELKELEKLKSEAMDCVEKYAKMLSLPKTAVSLESSNRHSAGLYEDDVFYNDNGELTAKVIMTFDSSLSAEDIAPYIKVHIDGLKDSISQLLQSSLSAQVCIYRFNNGDIIMSQCWYKDENGNLNAPMFFPSNQKDVAEIISRLYEEEGNPIQ